MMTANKKITVIGAGLAGCEAAWQAQKLGVGVTLIEMKPLRYSPAHHSDGFAELVCSNSLRSNQLSNAAGLLKEELRRLGSLIMEAADANAVPAGSSLAVDRVRFSDYITQKISSCENIEVVHAESDSIGDGITVVATGPLTSDALADTIRNMVGEGLHFFDAAAPIVDAASLNMDRIFLASRYGKGEACYLNCPMTAEEYDVFWHALITAEEAPLKDFDREQQELTVFEGCMPVEVMARRGYDTLRFGPMKPVGLPDPRTGKEAFAVLQLRQENTAASMYNLVGFQTHLTFGEQRRVFGLIPGLEHAEYLRYGVMHRNTFLDSPRLLAPDYSLRSRPSLFFAGQITGVEGYLESASSGFVAGLNAARRALNAEPLYLPSATQIGALAHYVSNPAVGSFEPMNASFGLMDPLNSKVRGGKSARHEALSQHALEVLAGIDLYAGIPKQDMGIPS